MRVVFAGLLFRVLYLKGYVLPTFISKTSTLNPRILSRNASTLNPKPQTEKIQTLNRDSLDFEVTRGKEYRLLFHSWFPSSKQVDFYFIVGSLQVNR